MFSFHTKVLSRS